MKIDSISAFLFEDRYVTESEAIGIAEQVARMMRRNFKLCYNQKTGEWEAKYWFYKFGRESYGHHVLGEAIRIATAKAAIRDPKIFGCTEVEIDALFKKFGNKKNARQ